jgi:uncharacterized delta-60 repeat protein
MKIIRQFISLAIGSLPLLQSTPLIAQDGILDNAFGTNGFVTSSLPSLHVHANKIAVQADGKILVCGYAEDQINFNPDILLFRYNSDGTLDNTFADNGAIHSDRGGWETVHAIMVQDDGKIVLAGAFSAPYEPADLALFRYNSTGSIDSTFGINGIVLTNCGSSDYAYSIVKLNDGKFIVTGGNGQTFLAKYTSDGVLDPTFGTNGVVITDPTVYSESFYSLAIQDDGKILMAGNINIPDTANFLIARFLPDGSVDHTFTSDGLIIFNSLYGNDYSKSISVLSDGKILLVGGCTDSGVTQLMRFNSDGTLDHTYGINGIVYTTLISSYYQIDACLQSNDKLVIAGTVYDFQGYDDFGLVRFNADGSIDQTFGTNGIQTTSVNEFDSPKAIVLQPDGKILVTGETTNASSGYMDVVVLRYTNSSIAGIVENNYSLSEVIVYPNPAVSSTTLDFATPLNNADCLLYNTNGKLVQELNHLTGSSITLKGDQLPKGVYFAQIMKDNLLIAEVQKIIFK